MGLMALALTPEQKEQPAAGHAVAGAHRCAAHDTDTNGQMVMKSKRETEGRVWYHAKADCDDENTTGGLMPSLNLSLWERV